MSRGQLRSAAAAVQRRRKRRNAGTNLITMSAVGPDATVVSEAGNSAAQQWFMEPDSPDPAPMVRTNNVITKGNASESFWRMWTYTPVGGPGKKVGIRFKAVRTTQIIDGNANVEEGFKPWFKWAASGGGTGPESVVGTIDATTPGAYSFFAQTNRPGSELIAKRSAGSESTSVYSFYTATKHRSYSVGTVEAIEFTLEWTSTSVIMKGYINDTLVITATDSSSTRCQQEGYIGVRCDYASFDLLGDVEVFDPDATVVTPPPPPPSSPTGLVQPAVTTNTAPSGTSLSATLASPATAGSILVGCLGADKNAGAITSPASHTTLATYNGLSTSGALAIKEAVGGETGHAWSWANTVGVTAMIAELNLGNVDLAGAVTQISPTPVDDANVSSRTVDLGAAPSGGWLIATSSMDSTNTTAVNNPLTGVDLLAVYEGGVGVTPGGNQGVALGYKRVESGGARIVTVNWNRTDQMWLAVTFLPDAAETRLTSLSNMSGPYYSTVPSNPTIDADSAAKVANLAAVPGQTGNHHFAYLEWATTHFAVASDPDRTVVKRTDPDITNFDTTLAQFHVDDSPINAPVQTYPQPGSLADGATWDGWLAIVDPSSGRGRAYWRAVDDGTQITETTSHAITYPGDGQVVEGLGRGDGLWVNLGTITVQEVAAAIADATDTYVIPHALSLQLPSNILDNAFRTPAIKTDGELAPASGRISQGSRVWMPRNVAPVETATGDPKARLFRAIHRTLQEYGAYVTDRTTGGGTTGPVTMTFERHDPANPAAMVWPEGVSGQTPGSTAPISEPLAIAKAYYDAGLVFSYYSLDGNTWDVNKRIPWSSMQVLASWNGV